MNPINQISLTIRQRYRQARTILKNEGFGVLKDRLKLKIQRRLGKQVLGVFDIGYEKWRSKNALPVESVRVASLIEDMAIKPRFSIIVPVYNVDPKWLTLMVESVQAQSYPFWQLCLVDDCSSDPEIKPLLLAWSKTEKNISVSFNDKNSGIAVTSNNALAMATGDYIALLDHDDELYVDALLENAIAINQHPGATLIYSDEDKVTLGDVHEAPFFKPDFSLELLRSQNYIGHFVVTKRAAIDAIDGFSLGVDGAQDYDLVLRLVEVGGDVVHIPKVLYHWREIPGSTASAFSEKSYAAKAGQQALQQHLDRSRLDAKALLGKYPGTYRAQHDILSNPKVSIIIPFKDQAELLDKCLTSIFKHTQWQDIEIIGIDNNSSELQTQEVIEKWTKKNRPVTFLAYPHPFNFSQVCNFGVDHATGEFIVLMNNDIEITSDGWVESLLEYAQQEAVGAVGGTLFYPNKTIQHAGIVLGIDYGAGHAFKHFPDTHTGYFLRHHIVHNVSAVTGALLMVKKSLYDEVGGLDETLGVAYNDVDFCLSLIEKGLRNVVTPYCSAIHHESVTRGYEIDSARQQRHDLEKARLQSKRAALFAKGDPFYNPNLTTRREDYSLNTAKH